MGGAYRVVVSGQARECPGIRSLLEECDAVQVGNEHHFNAWGDRAEAIQRRLGQFKDRYGDDFLWSALLPAPGR